MKKMIFAVALCLPMLSQAGSLAEQAIKESGANRDLLTYEQLQSLEDYETQLSKMSKSDLRFEKSILGAKKALSCLMADAVVISAGVGETLPVANAVVKMIASDIHDENVAATLAFMNAKTGTNNAEKIAGNITDIASDLEIGIGAVVGGAIASVPAVIIETISSGDIKKIETQIQAKFPGTQVITYKMKGERSLCGERQIKFSMVANAFAQKK